LQLNITSTIHIIFLIEKYYAVTQALKLLNKSWVTKYFNSQIKEQPTVTGWWTCAIWWYDGVIEFLLSLLL